MGRSNSRDQPPYDEGTMRSSSPKHAPSSAAPSRSAPEPAELRDGLSSEDVELLAGDDLPDEFEDLGAGDTEAASAELADDRALDHALVRRAQHGDMDAFEALVRRHEARAWRVAKNMLPNDEDAKDIAQEAFLRVHKNLANFDFQHAFTTWLYRIVTNLAIDHLRRRRIVATGTIAESDEGEVQVEDTQAEAPSADAERAETAQQVQEVLKTLAPHFQAVLVLRELEGLSCLDIARIVGATHVTVRWRLHRGRQLFQDEWERRQQARARKSNEVRSNGDRTNNDRRPS